MLRTLCLLFVSLLLVAACAAPPPPRAAVPGNEGSTPPALAEVTFIATEYAFDAPESLSAGWTRITLDNQGALPHDLYLFKIEEGKTMDDVMAALETEGPPEWADFYGITEAAAGESGWFAANLTPGGYVYLSFGQAEEGPPDAAQGMAGMLTVTGTAATGAAPLAADASIELIDYQFVVNGLRAGEQVLRVSNTGTELHEVILFKLREGKTFADFQAELEKQANGEEMAEEETAADPMGFAFLSPGVVNYAPQTLEAGEYVLICFLPSPKNEMQPHHALGMVQKVTVE